MNFQPELAAKVMAGEKTVTRRLVSDNPRSPWWREKCALKEDRLYAVCPGRGKHAIGKVRVVSVVQQRVGHLTEDEARREGFETAVDFWEAFRAINGPQEFDNRCWRVAFVVVPETDWPLWEGGEA